jgi:hypothetical protein
MAHAAWADMTAISIALCVCNGGQFLGEQLSSLGSQSRPPDEVVVGDDASEDESVSIVEEFAATVTFPIRIIRNATRLGVRRNFENVISCCSHDFIALCDQDDVWRPEKLRMLSSRLEEDAGTVAVFSDAEVVDAALQPLRYTMWEHIGFSDRRQRQFMDDRPWEAIFKDPVVTGATLMFRKTLNNKCLPIAGSWVHDAWIAQIAASQGRLWPIRDCLVLYRQHSANVIGGKRLALPEQLRRAGAVGRVGLVEREWARYSELHERLAGLPSTPRQSEMLSQVCAKLEHLLKRKELPPNRLRRVPTVVAECLSGNYRRFAKDWRNVMADLLMP